MITDDISFLNPQDVESMSILKDPSSLAILEPELVMVRLLSKQNREK